MKTIENRNNKQDIYKYSTNRLTRYLSQTQKLQNLLGLWVNSIDTENPKGHNQNINVIEIQAIKTKYFHTK